MRYLTKEWYNRMQYTSIYLGLKVNNKAEKLSEDFYQEVYAKAKKRHIKDLYDFTDYNKFKKIFLESIDDYNDLKEEDIEQEFRNANEEMFLGMSLEEHFDYCQNNLIEQYKSAIPENILNKVKDIRVLALGYASSEVYKLLKKYCDDNEKFVEEKLRESEKVEEEQFENEPISFIEESFHDCFIIDINKDKNDLVIELDNENEFTDKTEITFKNYNIILDEDIKETYWLYNEVYKNEVGYEVHILTSINDDLKELIIECDDIKIG